MRYSLRNQRKIIEAYGENTLTEAMEALDYVFNKCDVEKYIIEEDFGGKEYNVLVALHYRGLIRDDSTVYYKFFILGKKYDVYNLAYKEKIN